jgi:transcriptional regulator with XRE-family HTH domain
MEGAAVQEQSFGQLMRQLREQRDMTLPQLADQIHYSRGYLWEIERGRKLPGPDVVTAIDRALQAGGMLEAVAREGGEAVQRRCGCR